RVEIGQLYPLMVHVNLFGSSYSRTVEASLKKFI
ncbi:MAG: fructosamine-3-kinase, partial [Bacteroidia bacterium]